MSHDTTPVKSVEIAPNSGRRQDILGLLCRGLTNAEIGQQLGITARTVKWYVSQLLVTYDATNRTELVGILLSRDKVP